MWDCWSSTSSTQASDPAEAAILADPRNEWTVADRYANEEMFDRQQQGWDTARYRIPPAPAGRLLGHGDVVDLGDRAFEVIHTPGHSPGGIALYEKKTGILLSGDIVYDGPLIDDVYHSDIEDYVGTLLAMRDLDVSIVHGGHFPSFGKVRYQATHRRVCRWQTQSGLPLAGRLSDKAKRSLQRPLRARRSRGVTATGNCRLRPLAHLFRMTHEFGEHQREASHHQEDYDQTRYRQ